MTEKESFLNALKNRILLFDGAMGTEIQSYDPSPFYLLDEPDQNLDGVNTEHIGKAIALQSNVAQFLVVSLHHAALREAENVIGVFMGDDGVSQLHQIQNIESFLASLPTDAEATA